MTTNPATRPFWVVVGSGIDVRGIDVLGQIFDFSGIEKSEKLIKKTWQEFRDALSKGDFETTKKDSEYHGYGIESMRRVVKKYDGKLEYSVEPEWVITDIYLQQKDEI